MVLQSGSDMTDSPFYKVIYSEDFPFASTAGKDYTFEKQKEK